MTAVFKTKQIVPPPWPRFSDKEPECVPVFINYSRLPFELHPNYDKIRQEQRRAARKRKFKPNLSTADIQDKLNKSLNKAKQQFGKETLGQMSEQEINDIIGVSVPKSPKRESGNRVSLQLRSVL